MSRIQKIWLNTVLSLCVFQCTSCNESSQDKAHKDVQEISATGNAETNELSKFSNIDEKEAYTKARKVGFTTYEDVEVKPGGFARIFRDLKNSKKKKEYFLRLKNQGKAFSAEWSSLGILTEKGMIIWEGPEIPVVLRYNKNHYYMIVYNRENLKKDYYKYYVSKGLAFELIKSVQFPKELVTQNMWLDRDDYKVNGIWVNEVALNLEMNPDNPFFISETITPKIWHCLLTGKERWELDYPTKKQASEYMRRYKTSKLTKLVR